MYNISDELMKKVLSVINNATHSYTYGQVTALIKELMDSKQNDD